MIYKVCKIPKHKGTSTYLPHLLCRTPESQQQTRPPQEEPRPVSKELFEMNSRDPSCFFWRMDDREVAGLQTTTAEATQGHRIGCQMSHH